MEIVGKGVKRMGGIKERNERKKGKETKAKEKGMGRGLNGMGRERVV